MSNLKREIKTLELPKTKQKVSYYDYLLADEVFEILDIQDSKIRRNEMVKKCIVSVGDSSENVDQLVLKLPWADYQVIDKVMTGLLKGESEEKKSE